MEKTPMAMRKHVAIFGDTNVGKSTLFNNFRTEAAIVSDVSEQLRPCDQGDGAYPLRTYRTY
ncbi:MAG: GTPase [Monoglobus pectinilyticus]|uniref:GTPase n=1 Tax=Monoglobus pectinilyticus TaxID=1981510 RepID=UPI0039A23FC2